MFYSTSSHSALFALIDYRNAVTVTCSKIYSSISLWSCFTTFLMNIYMNKINEVWLLKYQKQKQLKPWESFYKPTISTQSCLLDLQVFPNQNFSIRWCLICHIFSKFLHRHRWHDHSQYHTYCKVVTSGLQLHRQPC